MKRFVEGEDRRQATLLPECLDDYVTQDNPVRVIDVFTDELVETFIDYKRKNEAEAVRLRPHPYEFALYYDV